MAQLAMLQPEDPVDFLDNYLLKHVANVEEQQQPQARKDEQQLLEDETQVHAQLHSQPSVALVLQRFLEWMGSALNAEKAYIGRKCVDPQGNSVVHFVASSTHPESSVVDKFVAQPTDEGDEEGAHRGIGSGNWSYLMCSRRSRLSVKMADLLLMQRATRSLLPRPSLYTWKMCFESHV
ncbi:hypothetical protein PF003_g2573 [Phytophthora fragariae]|nr:hypothetical protein PF003_g2573 [Phytophthora fragariae]